MIQEDGSVWTAGYNAYGQLGNGMTANSKYFVQVIGDGADAVAGGAYHSMIIKTDGSIWATGSNEYGQFGDDKTKSVDKFVRLSPFGKGAKHDTNKS